MTLHFELITPDRVMFRREVDALTLPTTMGEITILPNHAPLVATLVPGVARIRVADIEEDVAVAGGFLEVRADGRVRMLADAAERAPELNLSVIERAKTRAEEMMRGAIHTDDRAFAAAAAALEHELARYKVARKRASHHTPTIDAAVLPSDENPI